jgi:hypothetical protein
MPQRPQFRMQLVFPEAIQRAVELERQYPELAGITHTDKNRGVTEIILGRMLNLLERLPDGPARNALGAHLNNYLKPEPTQWPYRPPGAPKPAEQSPAGEGGGKPRNERDAPANPAELGELSRGNIDRPLDALPPDSAARASPPGPVKPRHYIPQWKVDEEQARTRERTPPPSGSQAITPSDPVKPPSTDKAAVGPPPVAPALLRLIEKEKGWKQKRTLQAMAVKWGKDPELPVQTLTDEINCSSSGNRVGDFRSILDQL